eukprot:CAMPEP_0174913732 /NCGR_PEP_ID=MMETSP0167-20121228/80471_1 /TAXON_ID=38298 /ORGANISM="Rhodella maculata, Strain CCMP736" /LENGTH=542 /DNA_ID=CAMNT_0016158467 /DNA_START=164 /DNA_END=1789 /DNA_ORIENTATION=+
MANSSSSPSSTQSTATPDMPSAPTAAPAAAPMQSRAAVAVGARPEAASSGPGHSAAASHWWYQHDALPDFPVGTSGAMSSRIPTTGLFLPAPSPPDAASSLLEPLPGASVAGAGAASTPLSTAPRPMPSAPGAHLHGAGAGRPPSDMARPPTVPAPARGVAAPATAARIAPGSSLDMDPGAQAARQIVPGFNMTRRYSHGLKKPTKLQLVNEVIRRDPSQQPKGWNVLKLEEWLLAHGPPAMASGEVEVKAMNWSKDRDLARLINAIFANGEDFVQRDRTVSRAALQELKGQARKTAWVKIAESFNDAALKIDGEDENSLIYADLIGDGHTLNGFWSGYIMTARKAEKTFKTDIRLALDDAHNKFCRSGNGDGGPVDKESQHVFSSEFKNFLGTAGGKFDFGLYYAYIVLTKNHILENVLSDIPLAAQASSTHVHRTVRGAIKNTARKEVMTKVSNYIDFCQAHEDEDRNANQSRVLADVETSEAEATAAKYKAIRQANFALVSVTAQLKEVDKELEELKGNEGSDEFKRATFLKRKLAESW